MKKVPILIDFIYFFSLKTKANPSPRGNGFVFTLFGDPYGFLPLDKGKANFSLRGVCRPRPAIEPLGENSAPTQKGHRKWCPFYYCLVYVSNTQTES